MKRAEQSLADPDILDLTRELVTARLLVEDLTVRAHGAKGDRRLDLEAALRDALRTADSLASGAARRAQQSGLHITVIEANRVIQMFSQGVTEQTHVWAQAGKLQDPIGFLKGVHAIIQRLIAANPKMITDGTAAG